MPYRGCLCAHVILLLEIKTFLGVPDDYDYNYDEGDFGDPSDYDVNEEVLPDPVFVTKPQTFLFNKGDTIR